MNRSEIVSVVNSFSRHSFLRVYKELHFKGANFSEIEFAYILYSRSICKSRKKAAKLHYRIVVCASIAPTSLVRYCANFFSKVGVSNFY